MHRGGPAKALVLFGPPGSGKGTQAKMLTQSLRYPHISTGDMLRDRVKSGDSTGRRVRDLLKAGHLVPDELVNEMVTDRIEQADCHDGFILDGYPRTLQQARFLLDELGRRNVQPCVVHLKVNEDKLVERLTGRRMCPQCGTLYNVSLKPPIVPGRCDMEGARLIVREDDKEHVIRQRFEAYEKLTRPVLRFFESNVPYFAVEASDAPPESVFRAIGKFISNGNCGPTK
jgi:adenylate kinase